MSKKWKEFAKYLKNCQNYMENFCEKLRKFDKLNKENF